jgi:hypothetical protein
VELDTEVKELRDRLKKAGENEKLLERERRRVEHLKGTVVQWQVRPDLLSLFLSLA